MMNAFDEESTYSETYMLVGATVEGEEEEEERDLQLLINIRYLTNGLITRLC